MLSLQGVHRKHAKARCLCYGQGAEAPQRPGSPDAAPPDDKRPRLTLDIMCPVRPPAPATCLPRGCSASAQVAPEPCACSHDAGAPLGRGSWSEHLDTVCRVGWLSGVGFSTAVCHAAHAGAQAWSAAAGRRAPRPSPVTAALLAALQDTCGPPLASCPLSAPPRAPAPPGLARDAQRQGARARARPAEAAAARAAAARSALPPSPFNTPYLLALPLPGRAATETHCMWLARGRAFNIRHAAGPCGHLVVSTSHACTHARRCSAGWTC